MNSSAPLLQVLSATSTLCVSDLIGLSDLAKKLKRPERGFDSWLATRLSQETKIALSEYQNTDSDPQSLQKKLLQDINNIIRGQSIYERDRFDRIELRPETKILKAQNPEGERLQCLNRLLMEDAYPKELSRRLDQPHSASVFIVPFVFDGIDEAKPCGHPMSCENIYYRPANDTDWILENKEERKSYFTTETRKIVFDDEFSGWYILHSPKAGPYGQEFLFKTTSNQRSLRALMRPPCVFLSQPKLNGTTVFEQLRLGMLIIQVCPLNDSSTDNISGLKNEWTLDDFLILNESFRYLKTPYPEHQSAFEEELNSFQKAFQSFLPEGNWLPKSDLYEERWKSLVRIPVPNGLKLSSKKDPFDCYSDNRAFVWTRALLEKNELEKITQLPGWREPIGLQQPCGYWIKLVNVDRPADTFCKNLISSPFEKEWIKDRTYMRWAADNCWYGFNSFGGAMLAEGKWYWRHWLQMYMDQILILIYIRVVLFGFNRRLSETALGVLKGGGNSKQVWRKDFMELRLAFTCFENTYVFPLFSNHQQAIEMYVIAREQMDIQAIYGEVSNQVRSSDECLEGVLAEIRSRRAQLLNDIAQLGLMYTVILSGIACVLSVFDAFSPDHLKSISTTMSISGVLILLTIGFLLHLKSKAEVGVRGSDPTRSEIEPSNTGSLDRGTHRCR